MCASSRKSGCALLAGHTHLALVGKGGGDGVKMELTPSLETGTTGKMM